MNIFLSKLISVAFNVIVFVLYTQVSSTPTLHKPVLPDLNLPIMEEESHYMSSPAEPSPQSNPDVRKRIGRPRLSDEQRKENKRKHSRLCASRYRERFNEENYEKAKNTMKMKDFEMYQVKHSKYHLVRQKIYQKRLVKKRDRTKRIREGKGTIDDQIRQQKDSEINQFHYQRRKRLGLLTPTLRKLKEKREQKKSEKNKVAEGKE